MSDKIVPFEGPKDAKIYLIGEAPGANEVRASRPFVGGAGTILNGLLSSAGITREEVRLANVVRVRPPGNRFEALSEEVVREGTLYLIEDILRCGPNVVVPLGNHPLFAVEQKWGITKWRGSVLGSKTLHCKVIPTFHPANIMRMWDNRLPALLDLKKVKKESGSNVVSRMEREQLVNPSFQEVIYHIMRMGKSKRVAFDLETTREGQGAHMTHIALADSAEWAISIPFTRTEDGEVVDVWSMEEELAILHALRRLFLNEKVEFVAQNAMFDMGVLKWRYNIDVPNLGMDTMCAFHCCYPELPKSLDFINSIYTDQPYYGWLAREGDWGFQRYNALDATVTWECAECIEHDMADIGVTEFYRNHVHPLLKPLLEMQLRGIRVDQEKVAELKEREEGKYEEALAKLEEVAGHPVNPNSPKQVAALLYNELGLPVKKSRTTGSTTTDVKSLEALAAKYKVPAVEHILAARKSRKLIGTYYEAPLLEGRMHTSYNIGGRMKDDQTTIVSAPATGRLSSSYSIVVGSGTNLQNFPRGEPREIFLPDEGKVLFEVDLSQVESRLVAWLANEPRLIEAYLRGDDVHKLNATWIYEKSVEKVTEEERYFAKKHVHAFNYGEGPGTFSMLAGITLTRAREIRDRYFTTFPAIRAWQLGIEAKLRKSRTMVTPFGRKRTFYGRWGDSLVREALAQVPQSTDTDLLNFAALIRLYRALLESGLDAQLLLQVHDSIVGQCLPGDLPKVRSLIDDAFDIELVLPAGPLTIPWEIKVGDNWGKMEEVEDE